MDDINPRVQGRFWHFVSADGKKTTTNNSRLEMEMCRVRWRCCLCRRGWFCAQTTRSLEDGNSLDGIGTFEKDLCRLGQTQGSQQTAVHGCGGKTTDIQNLTYNSDWFSTRLLTFQWPGGGGASAAFRCRRERSNFQVVQPARIGSVVKVNTYRL